MGRFSRAARQGDGIKGRCSIPIYSETHSCSHRNGGSCQGTCNVFVEGRCAQKQGDMVIFSLCQHSGVGTIDECSSTVLINGKGAARIKDSVKCSNCAEEQVIIDGADTVYFGD